jgi:hypothetical protein
MPSVSYIDGGWYCQSDKDRSGQWSIHCESDNQRSFSGVDFDLLGLTWKCNDDTGGFPVKSACTESWRPRRI